MRQIPNRPNWLFVKTKCVLMRWGPQAGPNQMSWRTWRWSHFTACMATAPTSNINCTDEFFLLLAAAEFSQNQFVNSITRVQFARELLAIPFSWNNLVGSLKLPCRVLRQDNCLPSPFVLCARLLKKNRMDRCVYIPARSLNSIYTLITHACRPI